MEKIVDYIKINKGELGLVEDITVIRMGDIDDIATSLPAIEITGYPSFALVPATDHRRLPYAKIEMYIHVSSNETPAKSFDKAAEMALNLSQLLNKSKMFQVTRFTDITPVYYLNDDGRINYTDFASVQLGVEVKLV